MAISLKIIEDHGGNITIKSEYGKGTKMSISLPINQQKGAINHDNDTSCGG